MFFSLWPKFFSSLTNWFLSCNGSMSTAIVVADVNMLAEQPLSEPDGPCCLAGSWDEKPSDLTSISKAAEDHWQAKHLPSSTARGPPRTLQHLGWHSGFQLPGTKKEPKPKHLSPDIFWWGGSSREGVGAKKFGMSLETQGIKLFWRDIPGFCRDIPEAPEKLRKKCLGSILVP